MAGAEHETNRRKSAAVPHNSKVGTMTYWAAIKMHGETCHMRLSSCGFGVVCGWWRAFDGSNLLSVLPRSTSPPKIVGVYSVPWLQSLYPLSSWAEICRRHSGEKASSVALPTKNAAICITDNIAHRQATATRCQ